MSAGKIRPARCDKHGAGRMLCQGPAAQSSVRCSGSRRDRKSTRLNSSHVKISYDVFCLKKKKQKKNELFNSKLIYILSPYTTLFRSKLTKLAESEANPEAQQKSK